VRFEKASFEDGVEVISEPTDQDQIPEAPAPADDSGARAAGAGASSGLHSASGAERIAPKGSPPRPTSEVPKTVAVWISTAAGLGFGPWAPGTWGALGTVLLFAPVFAGLGWLGYGVLVLAVTAVGVWSSTAAERDFGRHDDGRIVIDEVAGQLITLWPLVPLRGVDLGRFDLSFGLASDPGFLEVSIFSLLVVTGFVAFRWFDIRKPGAVRWAERRFEAGAGVMADDVVAGLYGAVALIVPAYVALVVAGRAGGLSG
jgi:phosphatidylglycerophosphatase A